MVSFPDSVKTWVDKTDLVDFFTATNLNDDIMDEIIAVEGATIGGYARGGPLDLYMDADPGFDQVLNSGDSYITYSAANDRLEIAITAAAVGTVRSIYGVLPTPIQFTPSPTAMIEMFIDFTVASVNVGSTAMVLLGFMDGALAQLYYETFGLNLDFDAGFNGAYACMGGSAGYSNLDLSLGGVAATRYVAKIGWQTSRPNCLTASLYNQSTGAVVTAEAHYNVSDSNAKDAQLPHFGVKFYLNGEEDDLTVYVHDMYARVIRA